MNFTAENILVTGGAGFIGSHFIRHYLQRNPNCRIINYDLLTYASNLENLADIEANPHYFFEQGDICDVERLQEIMHRFQIDSIVHFAAESHVDRSIENPENFIRTNIHGTYILLEVAKNTWQSHFDLDPNQCRFHHISTDEVYGSLSPDQECSREDSVYAPNSPYAASKASSDHLVRAYSKTYQLPTTLSNCSNNYGPQQHSEKLIPTVITSCLTQSAIPVYGDGSNIRDWLYVEDHCHAIELILKNGNVGETYNIGGNCEVNNNQMVHMICELMDRVKPENKPHKKLIQYVEDRKGHDWRYAIDCSKIEKTLGWVPQTTLEQGLLRTIKHYIKHHNHKGALLND